MKHTFMLDSTKPHYLDTLRYLRDQLQNDPSESEDVAELRRVDRAIAAYAGTENEQGEGEQSE